MNRCPNFVERMPCKWFRFMFCQGAPCTEYTDEERGIKDSTNFNSLQQTQYEINLKQYYGKNYIIHANMLQEMRSQDRKANMKKLKGKSIIKTKPLPCPFCGKNVFYVIRDGSNWNSGMGCRCGLEIYFFTKAGTNVACCSTSNQVLQQTAIVERWNRRATVHPTTNAACKPRTASKRAQDVVFNVLWRKTINAGKPAKERKTIWIHYVFKN